MGCNGKDLIRLMCTLPDGRTVISRHRPDHSTQLAVATPMVTGKPMAAGEEHVTIKNLGDGTYEITGSYVHGARSGPAQVATDGYRTRWEQTFNAPGGGA